MAHMFSKSLDGRLSSLSGVRNERENSQIGTQLPLPVVWLSPLHGSGRAAPAAHRGCAHFQYGRLIFT